MQTIRNAEVPNASGPLPRPSLRRVVTACHDEYLRPFRAIRLEGVLLDRAARPWRAARVRLASGHLEHGVDGAPWSATGRVGEGTAALVFAGSPEAQLRVEGRDVSRGFVRLLPSEARIALVARKPADWFVLSLPSSAVDAPPSARTAEGAATCSALHFHAGPEEPSQLRSLGRRLTGSAEARSPEDL
jgi:hypothetical protein